MIDLFKIIHTSKENNKQKEFCTIARELFNNYILNINGINYTLTEIEFYYFNTKTHKDIYTHLHYLQLEFGRFYVHEKSANRGGIDFTFGNGDNFGGMLIRGIRNTKTNESIFGPAKVRGEIAKTLFDIKESDENKDKKFYQKYNKPHKSLQVRINYSSMSFIQKSSNLKNIEFTKTERIGLTVKTVCNAQEFKKRYYRFLVDKVKN